MGAEEQHKPRAKKSVALSGTTAGNTAICTVGRTGNDLHYRGYDILDLAEACEFEEVAYLLIHGKLPNAAELRGYKQKLRSMRGLPATVLDALETLPAASHPMDVMRTGVSVLGCTLPEKDDHSVAGARDIADRLLASLGSMLAYWYRYSYSGERIDVETDDDSIGGHFLHMLHGEPPSKSWVKAMHTSLNLYAEHEFNASTFTARVIAATLSDFYSAVTGAIGALRGPLHGGANEAAMELIQRYETPEEADIGIRAALEEKKKIMGFGHRVYTTSDPRNKVIKKMAARLAEEVQDERLYPVSEQIEKVMWDEKKLFPNADFYSAAAYHFMGIPTKLFTPIFVCSRITGWSAHIMEQRANNRLIRPGAEYVGPSLQQWIPMDQRG